MRVSRRVASALWKTDFWPAKLPWSISKHGAETSSRRVIRLALTKPRTSSINDIVDFYVKLFFPDTLEPRTMCIHASRPRPF